MLNLTRDLDLQHSRSNKLALRGSLIESINLIWQRCTIQPFNIIDVSVRSLIATT
ncbi:hypothetical protein GIB67_034988 [Kingdonia uniflora]|uniref:Uncharacterized protein n=1 Tax=Kingdonia uniflora TaxID=39325 RepID=A0A7J7NH07_9MAGN|nr:hypothetical protein GIB67_034988 [Kingdonia uniflora]